MFLGTYEHNLDDKGRVNLPARYREILSAQGESRLIVTTNVDPAGRCLVAYPPKEWQAFQERIAGLPQFDENVIRLKRLHIAGAAECTPDRQGRILIPPTLREYAALGGALIFAGLGNSIELWGKAHWEEERQRAKEALPEINDALARLGL
ncbi:MAG: division/cell wall cluster transcriptional repressor MraZ [Deltaproteobacteria bacterium]|nr:division/cell wall cluster transcriptional repressor MraZ [Deltaproteobacteria bacterium]